MYNLYIYGYILCMLIMIITCFFMDTNISSDTTVTYKVIYCRWTLLNDVVLVYIRR